MIIQSKFSKSPHFTGWKRVVDVTAEVALKDEQREIVLEFEDEDGSKLRARISPADLTRLRLMLGLIHEVERL